MKIAVTSTGKTLDSQIDPRFGRAAFFIIIDTETMDYSVIENESVVVGSGAGVSSAKTVIDAGAKAVLTGNFGPNAHRTLQAAAIQLYNQLSGKVSDAVELFKNGKLNTSDEPNVNSHFGMDS